MSTVKIVDLYPLAEQLGDALLQRQLSLVSAESCTGGWVAKCVTDVPGSSAWFDRGFVTYTNISKQELLGVSAELLQEHGAVSEVVARAMAEGALAHSHADISLAITGIAGPGGGSLDKPVGLVWHAWAGAELPLSSRQYHYSGSREQIRCQAVFTAMHEVLERLVGHQ